MPLSLGPYGVVAFFILAGIVLVNEGIKYFKKDHHSL